MKKMNSSSTWVVVIACLAVLISVVAPALASHSSPTKAASNTRTRAVPSVAPSLVATAQNATGQRVSLWTAQSAAGGECQYLQFDGSTPANVLKNAASYPSCTVEPQSLPLTIHIGWVLNPDGTYSVGFNGGASPQSGITSLAFHSSNQGPSFVGKAGDYVGTFGNVQQSGTLPTGTYSIDGVGPDGKTVAHLDFADFLRHSLAPR